MLTRRMLRLTLLACVAGSVWAATFGTVVQIGGHASDIALDEARGRVYVANFTANKIQVVSTADLKLTKSQYVRAQPGALALSPDGNYLVVAHYANWTEPVSTNQPGITVLDPATLEERRYLALGNGDSPLAVAFGGGTQALVVSSTGFKLLDPATGVFQVLQPYVFDSTGLCVPFATFPREILQAAVGVSGDSRYIVGVAGLPGGAYAIFRYDVSTRELLILNVTASPTLGPNVVSVDQFGKNFLVGWALLNDGSAAKYSLVGQRVILMAEFPNPTGDYKIGGHAFDWARSTIYAQIPEAGTEASSAPVLHVVDSDNLTVRERIRLPENLAGRSLLNRDHSMMYSVSDSGLMALPVGTLYKAPRVTASREDVLFRGNFCDRRTMMQEIDILDAGGGSIDFKLSTTMAGVTLSPVAGTTPTRVKIFVDPSLYQNQKGTAAGAIELSSRAGISIPTPIRVLINTREPDQRGAVFSVPGKLVDILPDPVRDRFYVLRQDKNQVLVFSATTFQQLATLRTANTPTQMALTNDYRLLLVTNDHAQIMNVYDLDAQQQLTPVVMRGGHYPRSLGVSSNAALVVSRLAGGGGSVDRIDFESMLADTACLGIYCNSPENVSEETVLSTSPSRSMIFGTTPDGVVWLYEAQGDTIIAARQDFAALGGAMAALTDQIFLVDNHLLNWSLVQYGALDTTTGSSSGFTIHDGFGLRTTAASISSPGVIQRVDLTNWSTIIRPTKMIEAPLLVASMPTPPVGQIGQTILPFTRTLMVTSNRNSFVSLSVSGFVVLPWDFDAVLAKPVIQSVVNLADGTAAIAPGGLVAVKGTDLSRVTLANSELPVPTTLGEACLTFNSAKAPLLLVSPGQINAQVPFEVVGNASVVLRTAGGISEPFTVVVSPTAPAVFRTASAGPDTGLATLYRTANNEPVTLANPIHPEDYLVIYVTGLGATSPAVETGAPAPLDTLATAIISPSVKLGGVSLPVLFAGLVPGQVGVYQINVYVPLDAPRGMEVPLVIPRAGGDVSLSVRVVK